MVAVALNAGVAAIMCFAWLVLFHVLSIRPYLLEPQIDPTFFPKERLRASLGFGLYADAGALGWGYSPTLALLIFFALPVFYGITSEGLTQTTARLRYGRPPRKLSSHFIISTLRNKSWGLGHSDRSAFP